MQPPAVLGGSTAGTADRAGRSPRSWLWLLAVVTFGLLTDLGSKWLAFEHIAGAPVPVERDRVLTLAAEQGPRAIAALIPPHEPVVIVPHLLEFTLVLNPGAVFGIGPGKRWFFVAFTLGALVTGLVMFARATKPEQRWAHTALGLLMSGGLGNLYDRLVHGCVRDFLHPLPGIDWPWGLSTPWSGRAVWPYVSNIADLWLLVGIGILIVILWRADRHPVRDPA